MRALRLALVLALGACSPAYYDEPMETEVVLVQQPAEQPTVVVGDPNDPFAVPDSQPQVVQVQPQVQQPQVVQVQPQPQVVQVHQPVPQGPRIVSGPQPQSASACTNTCRYANDSECDDGRPGAHTSLCAYGTDCNDFGAAGVQVQRQGCVNTCRHANDGECDDGRPGSITSLCTYGSDCNDCGPG